MLIHQSDLGAWSRCAAEYGYKRAGLPDHGNSATVYGSVMHYALEVFERTRIAEGWEAAVQKATETFTFYWNPLNIEAITEPVPANGWLPRQGYMELRARGVDAIKKYADLTRYDDHELLATEYSFVVPIVGTWDDVLEEPHMLGGTIDRLAVRHFKRIEGLCIDDFKTGKEYRFLRHNLQFTAYAYATTQPEFWMGNAGEEGFGLDRGQQLYERFKNAGRRGTWINLQKFKFQDAGWRGEQDYARFRLAVTQFALSVQADIFPLSITGENCTYCSFRDICGGVGLAADDYADPTKK